MEFEDLKVIWDSQNQEPLYAVKAAALHDIVRHRNQDFHRRAAWIHFREIVIGLAFGLLMLAKAAFFALGDPSRLPAFSWIQIPITPWHLAALLAASIIWFYYAAFMLHARRRQSRREENFAHSLQGDLDRALDHVGFQIRIARGIVWWGLIPALIATVLWIMVVFHLKDVPPWAYAMMAGVMAAIFTLSVACQHRTIRKQFEPRRQELLSLRAKITQPLP